MFGKWCILIFLNIDLIVVYSESFSNVEFEHSSTSSSDYDDYDYDYGDERLVDPPVTKTLIIRNISSASEIKNRLTQNTEFIIVYDSKIETLSKSLFMKSKNLKEIRFEDGQISVIENGAFDELPLLTTVQFANSSLENLPINLFKPLKNLKTLVLRHNKLNKFEPELIATLTNFEYLNVGDNYLTKLDKDLFKDMRNLTIVDVSYNNLTELDDKMFSYTDQLKNLYLNNNNLKNFPNLSHVSSNLFMLVMQENNLTELNFGKLPICCMDLILRFAKNKIKTIKYADESAKNKIYFLDLNYNLLTEIPKIASVEILYLKNNNIHKLKSNDLTNMTRLRSLDISNNYISYIPMGIFSDTKTLQELNMSHNHIQSFEVGSLYGLDNVITLDLSYNKLHSLLEKHFITSFNNLEILYLNNNNIFRLEPSVLRDMNLKRLNIDRNSLSCTNLLDIFHLLRPPRTNNFYIKNRVYIAEGSTFNSSNVQGIACIDEKGSTNLNRNSTDNDTADILDSFISKFRDIMKTTHFNHDEWLKNMSVSFHKKWEKFKSNKQALMDSKTSNQIIVSNTGTNLLLSFILCCLVMLVIIFGLQSWRTRRNGFELESHFDTM